MDKEIFLAVSSDTSKTARKYKCMWYNLYRMWYITPRHYQETPHTVEKSQQFLNWMAKLYSPKQIEENFRLLRSKYDECCVCYEATTTKTDCGHYICKSCLDSLKYTDPFLCPMCRTKLLKYDLAVQYKTYAMKVFEFTIQNTIESFREMLKRVNQAEDKLNELDEIYNDMPDFITELD